MVTTPTNNIHRLMSSRRLSTVAPGSVTAEEHKVRELTNIELAMKLHYIKGVYFFSSDAVEGITIYDLKRPMVVEWLPIYFATNGRIRRSETGRPYIACNDAGVRIVEARCDDTVEEWLAMAVDQDDSTFDGLVYNQALGDQSDLDFSPLVFIQFTWFKCGGMSVGLSWANVLGDAFSASACINHWGKIMAGHLPLAIESLHERKAFQKGADSVRNEFSASTLINLLTKNVAADHTQDKSLHVPDLAISDELPLSSVVPNPIANAVKRVDSVGNLWLTPNNCKMKTHTFHVHAENINHLLSNQKPNVSAFEVLSALIWKSISKVKGNPKKTRTVTLCTNKSNRREFGSLCNGMVWSTVEADFWVAEAEVSELVELILNKRKDENGNIEEMMGTKGGENTADFIAYGAQLTFVNLEEMDIGGLEIKGQKTIYANYSISGVGDEGLALVLPGQKCGEEEGINGGRTVTVVLPENQLALLKVELERSWGIA